MEEPNEDFYKYDMHLAEVQQSINYPFKDCLITAKLLEPKDSNNFLKNLYNKFIRGSEVD